MSALCDANIIESQHNQIHHCGDEYGTALGGGHVRHRIRHSSGGVPDHLSRQTIQCFFCVAPGMRIGTKTIVVLIWTFFIALTCSLLTRYTSLSFINPLETGEFLYDTFYAFVYSSFITRADALKLQENHEDMFPQS